MEPNVIAYAKASACSFENSKNILKIRLSLESYNILFISNLVANFRNFP